MIEADEATEEATAESATSPGSFCAVSAMENNRAGPGVRRVPRISWLLGTLRAMAIARTGQLKQSVTDLPCGFGTNSQPLDCVVVTQQWQVSPRLRATRMSSQQAPGNALSTDPIVPRAVHLSLRLGMMRLFDMDDSYIQSALSQTRCPSLPPYSHGVVNFWCPEPWDPTRTVH